MKKHSKSIVLIGIVLFHSFQISAFGSRDIGDLGRKILHEINNTYTQAIVATFVSAAVLGGPQNRDEIANNIKLYFFPPTVGCLKHSELSLQPGITNSNVLPEEIQNILDQENISKNGHKFMLLVGETRTGKSLLARQIAYNQGADYYEVPQSALDGYSSKSVLNWLDNLMYRIEKQTEPGKKAVLNLDEFGKQLGTSGNQITDAANAEFINSFKDDFAKIARKYPSLLIMGTTNFGSADEPGIYNPAIAERINIVTTGKPTYAARENFLQSGCKGHLETNGIIHAKNSTTNHTKNYYNQEDDINKPLREKFHVTDAMIQAAAQKRAEDIKKLEKPWTLNTYLSPWLWIKTWQDNATAEQLKKSIFVTPVITYNIEPTDQQIDDYIDATQDVKNYTPLIADTEQARRKKLLQIGQMKTRKEDTSSSNPYHIEPSTRTCTVTHQSGDYNEATKKYEDRPKTISYNYGNVNASDILLEAQHRKNEEIVKERIKEVSFKSTQQDKIEAIQELIPTKDLVGLTRKLLIKQDETLQAEIEQLNNKRKIESQRFTDATGLNKKDNINAFKEFTKKEKAAITIQSIARGKAAKAKVKKLKEEKASQASSAN